MRNASSFARVALCLSLCAQPRGEIGRAVAPFHPVGYCAAVQTAGEDIRVFYGGDAVLGAKPVTEHTIFRVASVSKMLGAAAAMRLVARGLLTLDGDISDVLGFPIRKTITLRQLLTHTAALSDSALYDDVIGTPNMPPLSELLDKSFCDYEPGTAFLYSNLGAGVAGMLVETASGMLFDDFIRQEFFVPHGIDASFHPRRIVNKERMANCYNVPSQELSYDAYDIAAQPLDEKPNPQMHYSVPAGRLMISVPNLLVVLQRLYKEDSAIFTLQNGIGSVPFDARRGLGPMYVEKGIFSFHRAFWGHQGTAYGAVSQAWIDPADGTTAVFATNGARLSSMLPLQRVGQRAIAALVRP